MIRYRPFRNSDTPLLADVWRSQATRRGMMQPMSPAVLEELVLAKPTFDREGLILATQDDKALGFAHAGFGATDDLTGVSPTCGVINMLMVRANEHEKDVAGALVAESEAYLRGRGAKTIWAGGNRQPTPFYLGLYGGSALTGVLDSDRHTQQLYEAHGFQEMGHAVVLQRDLARFRPLVDRRQMQVRRRTSLQVIEDPTPGTWWEACMFGAFDRTRFELDARDGRPPMARATFWDMQALSATWGVHSAGLCELEVHETERRQGLATFLLGEAFRQLHARGVALVEVQVPVENVAALALFEKLGFEQVDRSASYRKD